MDAKLLHSLRASAEVVLDLSTNLIGGDIKPYPSSSHDTCVLQVRFNLPSAGVLSQVWASLSTLLQ